MNLAFNKSLIVIIFLSQFLSAMDKRNPILILPNSSTNISIFTNTTTNTANQYYNEVKFADNKNEALSIKFIIRHSISKKLEFGIELPYIFKRLQSTTKLDQEPIFKYDSLGLGDLDFQVNYLFRSFKTDVRFYKYWNLGEHIKENLGLPIYFDNSTLLGTHIELSYKMNSITIVELFYELGFSDLESYQFQEKEFDKINIIKQRFARRMKFNLYKKQSDKG